MDGDPQKKRRRQVLESDDDDDAVNMLSLDEVPGLRRVPRGRVATGGRGDAYGDSVDDNETPPSDDDEGEDLMENVIDDYQRIEELDKYDDAMLDNRQNLRQLDPAQRKEVEDELDKRDNREDHLAAFAAGGDGDDEDLEQRDARRKGFEAVGEEKFEDIVDLNLEAFDCSLREWIVQGRTRREIKRKFYNYLTTYQVDGRVVHKERIRAMCSRNDASLDVSFIQLMDASPLLAQWLVDEPTLMIEVFDEVAEEVVTEQFPSYVGPIVSEVHVRVSNLPLRDELRDLREEHIDSMVQVQGVVTRRSAVYPQLKECTYNCVACGHLSFPFRQSGAEEIKPVACVNCQGNGPFRLNMEKTVYRNYQKIVLQETPGTVPPGRVPRQKEVILLSDLIDRARPGEEITVIGIYKHAPDQQGPDAGGGRNGGGGGFPVFATSIEANSITKRDDAFSAASLTDDDRAGILRLSRDPRIGQRIVQSLAPSIYGQEHVKMAVAMALFGGCPKNVENKHRIRGDINVLVLGDPGTAKSQILKYSEMIAPRAVYTTGKGASAVGLTAGVRKDPMTKEWTLEGGALVLADRGLCLIDEFDKMSEQDRTSIHEAMEQQSISVSKAGIVTTLQARCAVIAAANPIGGVYDSSVTLAENVELTDPILQRFDVLCVLQDTIDSIADEKLATFVVNSHRRSHKDQRKRAATIATSSSTGAVGLMYGPPPHQQAPQMPLSATPSVGLVNDRGEETIPQDMLQKYIQYARVNVRPQLRGIEEAKISQLYADLRRESATAGGVPIAVRHIESVLRMSEAHAKMHLRDHVRDDDVDAAIRVMLESFIMAQKFSVRRSLRRGFAPYLADNRDYNELLLHALRQLANDEQTYQQMKNRRLPDYVNVSMDDLEARAREFRVYDLTNFYESAAFKADGFEAHPEKRLIYRSF